VAKRQVRGVVALLTTVVLAVGLGACSNDTKSSGSGGGGSGGAKIPKAGATSFTDLKRVAAPSPCKEDPGVSAQEIKVAGILPTSGPQAVSFSAAQDAIKARFAMENAAGGIGGRKLTLDVIDDGADPGKNATAARQAIEQNKAFGVISFTSASAGSTQYLYDNTIPVTGWHVGVSDWGKYPNLFSFAQSISPNPTRDYSTRNADLVRTLGGSKVALLGGQNQSSVTFMKQIAEVLKETPGMSVAYMTTDIPIASTEFTAEVQRIKQSGADSIVTGMDFLQNTALNAQVRQAGVNPKVVLFPGGYDPRVLALPGIDGATFGIEFKPFELNTPGFQDFKKWMNDKGMGQVTAGGWLAANLFVEGLKAAGAECPTRVAFINNLRLAKDYTANGFISPVNFSQIFGKQFQCVYYVRVENKKFVPLFEGKEFCGKPFTFKHGI
jgi:ABC-type branched-subunit amino acid transport system substrate-binding protein